MTRIPYAFYLAEDATNTVLDSALASVRYVAHVCDDPGDGSLRCKSMDGIPDGTLVPYRDRWFDGVGYCNDSVFAANQLIHLGDVLSSTQLQRMGERLADHAFAAGFFDDPALPVRMYMDADTGEFFNNLESRDSYIEPGHMARVGHQLLMLSDVYPARAQAARQAAERVIAWIPTLEKCENGWYPRRSTPDGQVFRHAPDAFGPVGLGGQNLPPDPIYDRAGTGTLILQLLAEGARRGIQGAREELEPAVDAFIAAGGFFGSLNSDTEDLHENVSYAMAFQAIQLAAEVLGRDDWRAFAYDACLAPLTGFEMVEDVNGLQTKGLLWMEESWNSACTWEIAEAAEAYLVAYADRVERSHVMKALTMLRGLAKHHHGPHGFLTEAVDWDGHSVGARHFDGKRYTDIFTTHPFLNNLHVVEPTVTYLTKFAQRGPHPDGGEAFYDLEGNLLGLATLGTVDWLPPA